VPVSAVRLTVVGNEMEAEVVCGLLRSNGIPCFQRKSDRAGAISASGGFSMAGPTEILVDEADLDAARKLLPDE
jgi:putative signal transducing protein